MKQNLKFGLVWAVGHGLEFDKKINFLNLKFNAGLNVNFEYQLRHYEKATKI